MKKGFVLMMIVEIVSGRVLRAIARIMKFTEPMQQRAKRIIRKLDGTSVTFIFSLKRQAYDARDIKIILTKVNSVKVANPTSLLMVSFPKTLFSANMNIDAFMNPSTSENLAGGF